MLILETKHDKTSNHHQQHCTWKKRIKPKSQTKVKMHINTIVAFSRSNTRK